MTRRSVLFVATGGSRRRAVSIESAEVLAAGGRATVIVDHLGAWKSSALPDGVEIVETTALELRHWARAWEQLLVFAAPAFVVRVLGRGALMRPVTRLHRAYLRLFATRLHRGLFMPVYRALTRRVRARLISRAVLRGAAYDAVVVSDPRSVIDVAAIRRADPYAFGAAPLTFRLTDAEAAGAVGAGAAR
ncbi:hypothetical protein GCM10009682_09580 [Luedemannella flava]|uniref:Uncharacterized protein n=1 Tax=Luedemannella flava TaxID=349316 RepID=A0ABN2LIU2_9ACTN